MYICTAHKISTYVRMYSFRRVAVCKLICHMSLLWDYRHIYVFTERDFIFRRKV